MFEGLFSTCQNFEPTLWKNYAIGQSFIVVGGQNWKHNLPIWSRWFLDRNQIVKVKWS